MTQPALQLFRAVAYRMERMDTPTSERQPEVAVFFEAPTLQAAPQHLTALLALAWNCETSLIDHYNLWSEADLRSHSTCDAAAGEAWLLQNGHHLGPLFCANSRTLMLVRPLTLVRLMKARDKANHLAMAQLRCLHRIDAARPPQVAVERRAYSSGVQDGLGGDAAAALSVPAAADIGRCC